ncbi:hypothetical protein EGW08_010797 [Elysia chlorotica]|uniref:Cytochrome P450 n=1 Tax=Elysia chlorotica TaxID=188477 RepID=A0A3S1BIC9_ELYCH|nr:hypothetical protein EGW08_010797 [Elysia chlorotica]
MLHHPEVQVKIFSEIAEVVGLEKAVTMHDKPKLKYTHAAIMETQRISISPLGVPHMSNADTIISGYTIPAGTTILSSNEFLYRSEENWKNAKHFRPERFLDAQGNLSVPEHFKPFGLGPRACPGESIAKMELFLYLASMIQRFELHPAEPGQLPSLEPQIGMIYFPQPFQLRFVERQRV